MANKTVDDALAKVSAWRDNPRMRPQPEAVRAVAGVLADRVVQLEQQLARVKRLAEGREVLILRGNPDRGPETGPGFGRHVPAIIEDALVEDWGVVCRLLCDDPGAVGAPCNKGDSGHWSASQIVIPVGN